ncbi:MAG: hypothetical protein LBV40_06810 [Methanomicrobiales archaeon]|jgi:GNAT superfamily N-acetyltransferase|nr:hypothetical protein [Methanomicrobiales archaeon]
MQNGYSVTHLAKLKETPVGFFTLVTDTIHMNVVDDVLFPCYDYNKLPAVKIARLATHCNYEGMGVGRFMLTDIFKQVYRVTKNIGCCAITVDAKRSSVWFYKKYAFYEAKSKSNQNTVVMYMNLRQFIVHNKKFIF